MIWLVWVGLLFSCHDLVVMGGTCIQMPLFGCYRWDLYSVFRFDCYGWDLSSIVMIWLFWVGLVFRCHDLVVMGGTCLQLS